MTKPKNVKYKNRFHTKYFRIHGGSIPLHHDKSLPIPLDPQEEADRIFPFKSISDDEIRELIFSQLRYARKDELPGVFGQDSEDFTKAMTRARLETIISQLKNKRSGVFNKEKFDGVIIDLYYYLTEKLTIPWTGEIPTDLLTIIKREAETTEEFRKYLQGVLYNTRIDFIRALTKEYDAVIPFSNIPIPDGEKDGDESLKDNDKNILEDPTAYPINKDSWGRDTWELTKRCFRKLNKRERFIFKEIARGRNQNEISEELNISPSAVSNIINYIRIKYKSEYADIQKVRNRKIRKIRRGTVEKRNLIKDLQSDPNEFSDEDFDVLAFLKLRYPGILPKIVKPVSQKHPLCDNTIRWIQKGRDIWGKYEWFNVENQFEKLITSDSVKADVKVRSILVQEIHK
jgi:DNA-directed RNA polymerase specialized sigma24 family protein